MSTDYTIKYPAKKLADREFLCRGWTGFNEAWHDAGYSTAALCVKLDNMLIAKTGDGNYADSQHMGDLIRARLVKHMTEHGWISAEVIRREMENGLQELIDR